MNIESKPFPVLPSATLSIGSSTTKFLMIRSRNHPGKPNEEMAAGLENRVD
jgi:hypothetical protein